MINTDLEIINDKGLHARASARFVETASQFECEIKVSKDGETVHADSIMGLLMLGAAKGCVINVSADGTDENKAIDALKNLVLNRFGEES